MEDPRPLPNDDPSSEADDASELQRQAEEAMEQMLMAQEDEEYAEEGGSGSDNNNNEDNFLDRDFAEGADGDDPLGFAAGDAHLCTRAAAIP